MPAHGSALHSSTTKEHFDGCQGTPIKPQGVAWGRNRKEIAARAWAVGRTVGIK
jgi:hypothetical protein